MIRAVLFDLEGTLVDGAAAHERALREVYTVLARFRPRLSEAELRRQFAGSLRVGVRSRTGLPVEPHVVYTERFKRTLAWLGEGDDNLARRLGRLYASLVLDRAVAYADALEALPLLAAHVTLAVVANGATSAHRRRLAAAGLDRWLPHVFGSHEAGAAKPDPGLLLHALQGLELAPDEAVAVGDAPETDVAAAQAAGVRAVWLNRARRPLPAGAPVPDRTVASLLDLGPLLG